MPDGGASLYIGLAAAAASATAAGTSAYVQNQTANRNVRKSRDAAREAASVQKTQVDAQAQQDRAAQIRTSQQRRARILAAAGEAGGLSSDFDSLLTQENTNLNSNLQTLSTNLRQNINLIDSGTRSNLIQLNNRLAPTALNTGTSAIQGGIAGGQAGYQLGQLYRPDDPPINTPATSGSSGYQYL